MRMILSNTTCDTISRFSVRLLRGFCLHHTRRKLFAIEKSSTDSRVKQHKAAADGFLHAHPGMVAKPENIQRIFDLLYKYYLTDFAIWEFKSLVAGDHIMNGIAKLEGDSFPWIACQERLQDDEASKHCGTDNHRIKGRPRITGRQTGPDAKDLEPLVAYPTPCSPKNSLKLNSKANIPCASGTSEKRSYEEEGSPPIAGPAEERRWKSLDEYISIHNGATSSKQIREFEKDTIATVQQTWVSAVVKDATFMVISSGNEEFIGIRHRDSQTLFLSPRIRVDMDMADSYAKLHVGLIIASFEDAYNRACQISACSTGSPALSLPSRYKLKLDFDVVVEKQKDHDAEKNKFDETLLARFEMAHGISLRLNDGDTIGKRSPYSDTVWYFSRICFNEESGTLEEPNPRKYNFFLDAEPTGGRLTQRVRTVYLGRKGLAGSYPDYYSKNLVMKVAVEPGHIEEMEMEYMAYCQLSKAKVRSIVKTFGFFTCEVKDNVICSILLMEYGGKSLAIRVDDKFLGNSERQERCRRDLASFHQIGWTHNNISDGHVLIENKTPKFISLSQSTLNASTFEEVEEDENHLAKKEQDEIRLADCLRPVQESSQYLFELLSESDGSQEMSPSP